MGFTQVLVYVGAVAILAVFAIMMTHGPETQDGDLVRSRCWLWGGVVAAAVFAVLGLGDLPAAQSAACAASA